MSQWFQKKELIYTICQERSFSRAANKLYTSQPALSNMVKNLEEELGVPLFDRSSKPVRLTPAGQEYIRAAEQIREIETAFENYILALKNLETGTLAVGGNQLLSSLMLPWYIARFLQAYPKIELSLVEANSTQLENEIKAGNLDLIIDNALLDRSVFEQERLATEHLLLAVPTSFQENEKCRDAALTYQDIVENRHIHWDKYPPMEAFADTPFILMRKDSDIRKRTNAIFQELHFHPKVFMEMDRLTNSYSYVEQGVAASVVNDTMVRHIRGREQYRLTFYTLPTQFCKQDIYVSYKRNRFCSRAMTLFIDSLRDWK